MKYLVTTLDGYSLEVETFFLNAESLAEVVDYIQQNINEDYHILVNENLQTVYGEIECDNRHMVTTSWIFVNPVDRVEEYTALCL